MQSCGRLFLFVAVGAAHRNNRPCNLAARRMTGKRFRPARLGPRAAGAALAASAGAATAGTSGPPPPPPPPPARRAGPRALPAAPGGPRAASAERRSDSRRRQLPDLYPVPREDGNQHAVALRVVADVGRTRHAGDQLHLLAGFVARYGRITPARDEDPAADDLDAVEPARALGDHTRRLVPRLPREH